MPLRAYIDNEEIISIDQDDKQWEDIKKRLKSKESVLILPCCKQVGFLRTSSKGLKHFVHIKSDNICDWKPESPEHLRAKIDIIEACKEIGWKAIPEFSETKWRADVLAIQNGKRIAFEVQWSKQTFEETKFRQERYKESNVRGCWFFRITPKELRDFNNNPLANKEIPAFKILQDSEGNIIAQLGLEQQPLKSLVNRLLKRQLRFCEHIRLKPKQKVSIVFNEITCWKCNKPQHIWTVKQNLQTVCNQHFYVMRSDWDSDDIDKHPKVYEAVKEFLNTESGKNIRVGQLKKRPSGIVGKRYLSYGCYSCDIIFGDFHLRADKSEVPNNPRSIVYETEIDLGMMREEEKHWCYSENGDFCE